MLLPCNEVYIRTLLIRTVRLKPTNKFKIGGGWSVFIGFAKYQIFYTILDLVHFCEQNSNFEEMKIKRNYSSINDIRRFLNLKAAELNILLQLSKTLAISKNSCTAELYLQLLIFPSG